MFLIYFFMDFIKAKNGYYVHNICNFIWKLCTVSVQSTYLKLEKNLGIFETSLYDKL